MKVGLIMLGLIVLPIAGMAQVSDTTAVGNWEGKLSVSGITLRIRFHIREAKKGSLAATMDSPDQNANGIPVTSVTQHQNHIKLEVASINGIYEGTITSDANEIKGTWKQNGQTFTLNLQRMSGQSGETRATFPQEPEPPYPYNADSVTFQNKSDHIRLAGTLTYPDAMGPFPAVVLISGSGAQNRNENIMGHKPFLVIADYLTRHGFAVLRYDDRGVGASGGSMKGATTKDLSNDVESAVTYLSGRKIIDKDHIGLIGHSEGGTQAILETNRDKRVAALILLATPALPGRMITIEQIENISKAQGVPQSSIDMNVDLQKKLISLLNDNPDSSRMATRVDQILKNELPQLSDEKRLQMAKNISNQLNDRWSHFYLEFDPRKDLSKLRIPVLALYGTKDLQVSAKSNAAEARKALSSNKQAQVQVLDSLNHLFQRAGTGLPNEYAKIKQTFSPKALHMITQWLDKNLR